MGRKPTAFKAFEDLLRRVLAVPKEEIDKRERDWRKDRMSKAKDASKHKSNR